ncbi:MAG TPA: TetR/AcrR family transcriptional regulator, partial [Spirochaetota bacterium]|nr:TetR/AcrR family transcriptional regulator [Spirochaetota bacterium]
MHTLLRKQAEKKDRKKIILKAARSLLLKKGYDAVSIRQIADICELGAGTIYSYFSGKAEIYATLSIEVFDLLRDTFQTAADNCSSPTDKLRAMGISLMEFSVKHKAFYDLLDYFVSSPRMIFPR